ncbi:hypothetical protein I4U23_031493 [Adineta vaga]|nr:hypothetical protein I4U23_031493 [Adineta vaga]
MIQLNSGYSINESQFPLLNSTSNIINETIESIVNRLMIDNWRTTVNFSAYFKSCAPSFCTYQYTQHHSFTYVILTVVGIFGGPITALKFSVPIAVRIFRTMKTGRNPTSPGLRRQIRMFFVSYNLFFKINSNELQLRVQRQMTWFYLSIFTMTCTIVFLSLALRLHVNVVSVSSPSLTDYHKLETITSLQCSCSRLAIRYSSFLSMEPPTYHQVCSSDFVSQRWILHMFSTNMNPPNTSLNYIEPWPHLFDFRSIATYQFRLLASFCDLINSTVTAALEQLVSQDFVSALLLPEFQFISQITSLFEQLKQSTASTFLASLRLIRAHMHNDALMTMPSSNWQFIDMNATEFTKVHTKPVLYGEPTANCSCALTPLCVQPARIDGNVILPGLMVGCFPLESLLQSTLELLYNQTLVDFISNSNNATFKALVSGTQDQPNVTTVESMLSELMVEQWKTITNLTSYADYYAQCSPSFCSYTYISRQDLLASITSLIAFIGGFSVGARIAMPFLIRFVQLIKRRRMRVHSAVPEY